jgi:hypothetical protein
MTKQGSFKRRVRERMSQTGERYAAARSQVARKRDRVRAARSRLAAPADRPSDDRVREATGKRWETWFGVLDRWEARGRTNAATVNFLVDEHHLSVWWAQTITTWYLRARGVRLKHQQADGFTVYASKTIAVPLDAVFEAFVNPRARRRWLTDGTMRLRTSRPGRTARFDWGDGATRVGVSFEEKGPAKATVAVAHERLPDPDEAEIAKAAWSGRLADLKSLLEG